MAQFSNDILKYIGGPGLPEIKDCEVKELPVLPTFLDEAIMNYIRGIKNPDDAVARLDLVILKHTLAAAESYTFGRTQLVRFIGKLYAGTHDLLTYLSAVRNFENCVGAIWKASEAFNRMEHKALGQKIAHLTLYTRGEGSDLERLSAVNNAAKHFDELRAARAAAHVWISEKGIECAEGLVTFDELFDNIVALSEVNRQIFVEIPKEAMQRSKLEATD